MRPHRRTSEWTAPDGSQTPPAALLDALVEVLEEVLSGRPSGQIDGHTTLFSERAGADSVDSFEAMELVARIEDRYPAFDVEQLGLADIRTVATLAAALGRQLQFETSGEGS